MIELPEAVVIARQITETLGGSIYYCAGCQRP